MEETAYKVSPEEIQFRLLMTLHGQYMEDYKAPVIFMEESLAESDPPWKVIERELIQLEYEGWIQSSSDLMPGTVMCKLTPKGREVFEELTEGIAQRAQYEIGFVLDEWEGEQ